MRRWPALVAVLALSACVSPRAELPAAPISYGAAITVDSAPVPIDPRDPAQERFGNFTYAGGINPTSSQTSRLHGLSDMKILPDGRMLAVGDQADLLEARLVLDAAGRLVGLGEARMSSLEDAHGTDVHAGGQLEWDAEGLAVLPGGDMLVSFEHHDRVLLYPAGGGPPREVPKPRIAYVPNQAMEALAAAPDVAPDAYRVGIEPTGQVFLCRVWAECGPDRQAGLEDGLDLVAMESLPDGRMAYLIRTFTVARGNVNRVKIVDAAGRLVDRLDIGPPLTTENFEGLAAVPGQDGKVRLYLLSDDNFGVFNGRPTGQRTLLLAFDWTPPTGRGP